MQQHELELKFGVPAAALESLRSALRARGASRLRLQARYHDTADGLLASHLIALRLRLEGRRWVQTLKAPGDGSVHRLEHEVAVPLRPGGQQAPALDIRRHQGSAAGKALEAALGCELGDAPGGAPAAAPPAALVERHATDIWRLHCLLQDAAGTQIEVALDTGTASAGPHSVPIAELELEHKGGPVQGLFDLAAAWVAHGGLWLSTISKAERGERLLRGAAAPPPVKARPLQPAAHADGPALLRAMLQSVLEQVLGNASNVAEGVAEDDTVHQLRVGLRRLRTLLRELAALSPAIVPAWDAALAHTFGQLGQRRDAQAVAAAVRPLLEAAAAPRLAWQAPASADPASSVREPAFQSTLLAVLALAHAGDGRFTPMSAEAAHDLIAGRLRKLHRQVTRDGEHFEQLALAAQHRVRKRVKRLRYLAEFSIALWPGTQQRRYLKRLAAAQDALGRHNDVAVAAQAFHHDAANQPDAWFAAGYLQAHLAVTGRAARKALVKLPRHSRF